MIIIEYNFERENSRVFLFSLLLFLKNINLVLKVRLTATSPALEFQFGVDPLGRGRFIQHGIINDIVCQVSFILEYLPNRRHTA